MTDRPEWPRVSVVIPVRNSASTLERVLAAVVAQDYPGEVEVIAAIGESADESRRILEDAVPDGVRVVANPAGTTPAGLNAAIAASTGDVVVRVDGHAVVPRDYLRGIVETLDRTGADGVGGVQCPVGTTPVERAVAAAMASPLGSGGAAYRSGATSGPVDTVYLGAYRRATLEAVGGYDATMERNQDAELNARIRGEGGTIWLEPSLVVEYRPRGSWRELARQFHDYGRWRAVTARRHRGSLRARQLVPVGAVVGLAGAAVAVLLGRREALAVPAVYATALAVGALRAGDVEAGVRARMPIAWAVMHLAWGSGFLRSLVRPPA